MRGRSFRRSGFMEQPWLETLLRWTARRRRHTLPLVPAATVRRSPDRKTVRDPCLRRITFVRLLW